MFDDLRTGIDLALRLPLYLRRVIDFDRECTEIRHRLEQRATSFLLLARRAIYEHRSSPYRALLEHAGCELGDLERLVWTEGLEGALAELLRRGVYLTMDEFKGRRPLIRGSLQRQVDPAMFRNPLSRQHIISRSGGSRGPRLPVPLDLENIYDRALHTCLPIMARGGLDWRLAVWKIPGGALPTFLQHSLLPRLPARWFLMVNPNSPDTPARYSWSDRVVGLASRLARRPLPAPEFVSLADPLPIARWMAEVLAAGATAYLDTFPGPAVELCRVARASGVDLEGASFSLAGEPLTEARLAAIRSTGATAISRYSTSESGPLGSGCLAASVADEQHLLEDCHAVIQADDVSPDLLPADALLVTALRGSTSLILLNVAFGDRGSLEERRCGCPLEPIGWTRHLSGVRSYEKLTAHGMTFPDSDVVRVLEETLPAHFGGGPNDFQLVEASEADGQPALILRVHPRVPDYQPDEVTRVFFEALARPGDAQRLMGRVWEDAVVLKIKREQPVASAGGKILHVIGL